MAYALSTPLFTAQAANANSAAVDWNGGRGVFAAYGTFGGGTCKLQFSMDGATTWLDVDRSGDTYTTFTVNGAGGFELPPCSVRAVLSGATTPSVGAVIATSKS